MNLKRQLLLVSLLTLLLPWAGCEFIRETESALRTVQQRMLAGNARAVAANMAQHTNEYPERIDATRASEQLFVHSLSKPPTIDGYFDDWQLESASLRTLNGPEGPVRIAAGAYAATTYVYVEVSDRNLVYATQETMVLDDGPRYADRIKLLSSKPAYFDDQFTFAAEAPGPIISYKQSDYGFLPEPAIAAYWQDIPGGYRLEARIPSSLLGPNLGIVVSNTADETQRATRVASFSGTAPGPVVRSSRELQDIAGSLVEVGTRVIITDTAGWRIATAGSLSAATTADSSSAGWSRRIYDLLVESGEDAASADPHSSGRERESYVSAALNGREMPTWFRGSDSGRAIVAVAAPIRDGNEIIGALILQQGTDAILSLTNEGLVRLINMTLIVTVLVAGILLGYATWLSRRIRYLSLAAEAALENETLQAALPSALADDEIGDLSRSFSSTLRQLGDYNAYLRSLASKLSHELRTPLAIVTSSLENLEHEQLNEASLGYTARALDGAGRLRRILSAMSEASRVEELMEHAEPEPFDLYAALLSTTGAYRDVYKDRRFSFDSELSDAPSVGSPELLIQMLDKLVDNAVDFSKSGDTIRIGLSALDDVMQITVMNPGPPLPEHMRSQMFDSMVSVRGGENTRHLGLGLYVAKLIAERHGGRISADNVDDGVVFEVRLPIQDSR
jgi:two-component system sensor histidine kinase ChvG